MGSQPSDPNLIPKWTESVMVTLSRQLCASTHVGHARRIRPDTILIIYISFPTSPQTSCYQFMITFWYQKSLNVRCALGVTSETNKIRFYFEKSLLHTNLCNNFLTIIVCLFVNELLLSFSVWNMSKLKNSLRRFKIILLS